MADLLTALRQLIGQVVFWAIVAPWEQAIRVRAGKHVRRLQPGLHLRIPIIDIVFKKSVRRRSAMISTQTLQTQRGVLVVSATLGYVIADIERLYQSLHDAHDTIVQMAAAEIARHVLEESADRSSDGIAFAVSATLNPMFAEFGLSEVSVRVTDLAYVRTYRVLNDGRWSHEAALATEPTQ